MEAYVTLATSDEYALGALVLAQSLRESNTSKQLCCMISKNLSDSVKSALSTTFDLVEYVDVLDSGDSVNLALLKRPDLGVTFTKLHCWRLTQYSKAVFLDADTLVLRNIDDLFLRDELSAAPDPGWPDCFNSGVFVFKPSLETYSKLLDHAVSLGSYDGGDQGLLNLFFSDWSTADIKKHLPFTDNCVSVAFYSYLPAFQRFRSNIRVAHFIGALKPWHHRFDINTGQVLPQDESGKYSVEFLNQWWRIFMHKVKPNLDPNVCGFVGELAKLETPKAGPISGNESLAHPLPGQSPSGSQQVQRQMAWERGEMDYTGSDRFDMIASRLDSSMGKK